MNPIHPKLNWGEFERVRAKRKRRKFLWWFTLSLGMLTLVGASAYWLAFDKVNFGQEPTTQTGLTERDQNTVSKPKEMVSPLEMQSADQIQQNTGTAQTKTQTVQPSLSTEKIAPQAIVKRLEKKVEVAVDENFAAQKPKVDQHLSSEKTLVEVDKQLDTLSGTVAVSTNAIDTLPLTTNMVTTSTATSAAGKKGKVVPIFDSWLLFSWLPWHSAVLSSSEQPFNGRLDYRPLNSFNLTAGVKVYTSRRISLSIEPQYMLLRFQTQYTENLETYIIAPGSIIGYVQDFKGVQPIFSDTLRGTSVVQSFTNGVQQELNLPLNVSANLWSRKNLKLSLNVSTGIQYVFVLNGKWYEQDKFYDLDQPTNRLGFVGSGGLQLQFQPGKLTYQLGMSTNYRTVLSPQQLPWRNQLGISIGIPLSKR